MFNKKRLFIFGAFLIALFFMTMYASELNQNETIATRTVKFVDGYNNTEIFSQKVEVGKEAQVPEVPKHENLVFTGWYEGETKVSQFNNIIKDLTVIAKYADDINNNGIADSSDTYYDVTFYDTVANSNIRVVKVLTGMNATAPVTPVYEGRTFAGWSRGFNNVTSNITVNANYRVTNLDSTVTTYEVKFVNGLTNDVIGSFTVEEGLTANPPTAPKVAKKVFSHWDREYSDIRSNITVTAVYKDDLNENGKADEAETRYTINFIVDGKGSLTGETEFKNLLIDLNFEGEYPTPVAEEGYTFIGWEPTLPTTGFKITGNETFKAVFKDITAPILEKPIKYENGDLAENSIINSSRKIAIKQMELNPSEVYVELMKKDSAGIWRKVYGQGYKNTNEFLFDINVTNLEDDIYQVKFTQKDTYGNKSGYSYTFELDKTAPTLKFTDGNGKEILNNSIVNPALLGKGILRVSVLESNDVKVYIDGNYNKNHKKSFTIQYLSEGTHTIKIVDEAGNESDEYKITIDNTKPTVQVNLNRKSYLTNGGYANAVSKPEIEAKDENLDGFGIFNESGKRVSGPTGENVKERRALIDWLNEGTYTVIALDKAGNESEPFKLTIDKTSPIAKIITPDIDGKLFGKNVVITGEIDASEEHIKSHWFEITNPDGTLSYASNMNTNKLSHSFNLDTSKGSGTYKIRYVATDKAGNRSDDPGYTNSVIRILNIDATNPETSIEVSKVENGKFTVSGLATDNTRLNRVYVQLVNRTTNERCGGTTINLLSPDQKETTWSVDYDIRTLTVTGSSKSCSKEGNFAAHVSVVDQFGNTGSAGWTEDFLIDITKPVINAYLDSVNKTKLTNGQTINHKGYLNINIVDANVDKFYINNVEYTQYLGATWFNIAWAIKADGVYTLKSADKVGNESTLTFTYDTIDPVLKLKGANTLEFYRGENYNETFADLETLDNTDTIFVSKITFKAEGTTTYETVSKVNTSKTGIYYVYYQAKDLAGNLSNEVSRGVLVKSFSFTATVVSRNLEYIGPIVPSTSYSKQGGGFQLFSATLDKELNLNNLSLYYAYGDSETSLNSRTNAKALKSSLNNGIAGPVSTKVSSIYKNGIMPAGITVNHQENALLSTHRDFANQLIAMPEGESVYVRTVLLYTLFGYSYEAPIGNLVKYTKTADGKISMQTI